MYSTETLKEIDEFLKIDKEIQGNVVWNKSDEKNVYEARFPLSSAGNLLVKFDFEGTSNSKGNTYLRSGTLKIFHSLNMEKIMVCRMHILPGNKHTNPCIKGCDVSGLTLDAYKTRFYSWNDAKLLYQSLHPNNKHIARNIEGVETFEESINYFLNYANIKGNIPLPEYNIQLL